MNDDGTIKVFHYTKHKKFELLIQYFEQAKHEKIPSLIRIIFNQIRVAQFQAATYRHDTIIVAIAIRYTETSVVKAKLVGCCKPFCVCEFFLERCFYIKSCHHNEVMTLMIYVFVIIYVILLYTCMLEFFKYPIRHQIVPKQGGHFGKIICTLVCH